MSRWFRFLPLAFNRQQYTCLTTDKRADYSLSHLAAVLAVGWPGRVYVSVHGAFFDAAGSQDDGKAALFVSGFVSTPERWERFEYGWRELLRRHEITPPFHMSDFAYGNGQYESWYEDRERRKEFLSRAVDVILRNVLWSFSSGVLLADYDLVNQEYTIAESRGQPYALCAITSTQRMLQWMKQRHIERVVTVYEDGDNGRGDFIDRYRAIAGQSPHMAKKSEYTALQAADVLAYEHAKLVRDMGNKRVIRVEDVRIPFQRFEDDGRISWGFHNEESLRNFVITQQIPKR